MEIDYLFFFYELDEINYRLFKILSLLWLNWSSVQFLFFRYEYVDDLFSYRE